MYGDDSDVANGYIDTVEFSNEVIGIDFVDGTNDIEGIIFLLADSTVHRVGRDQKYNGVASTSPLALKDFTGVYLEGRLVGFNVRYGF